MKIVVWLTSSVSAFSIGTQRLGELRRSYPAHEFISVSDEGEFLQALAQAEAALCWSFSSSFYARAPRLRFVATPAAGRESIEPDPSGRVPALHGHFHGKIMAETLLAMMLSVSRGLALAQLDQQRRRYEREPYASTRRLAGQAALIVGYGHLGRECARLLTACGLRVSGVKRNANVDPGPAEAVYELARLPELLPLVDHVVLTLPGDTGTTHLFSDAAFRAMRPSARFYNLGRGNAVDEAALVRALRASTIAHAFLDVFEHEPLATDSPLWDCPNLALTPHASAISADYLDLWFEELKSELARS